MLWQRSMSDKQLRRRLLVLAGDPAFAQSPERQLKLAERSVSLIMEAVLAADWHQALALAASSWRFELLALLADRMSAEERWRLLVVWWTTCDGHIWPWRKRVLAWTRESGYIGSLPKPGETMTLFRGVSKPAHRFGLSWSPDQDDARHFALVAGAPGCLYAAQVPPEAVLAGFEGPGLQTYVVNPRLLINLSRVGRIRPGVTRS